MATAVLQKISDISPATFPKGREVALIAVLSRHNLVPAERKVPKLLGVIGFPDDDWHQWIRVLANYLEILTPLEEERSWIRQFRRYRHAVSDVSHREIYLGFLHNGRLLACPINTIVH